MVQVLKQTRSWGILGVPKLGKWIARERVPPMGVVKRERRLQRLFHWFMRRSRDFFGFELSTHSRPPGGNGATRKCCLSTPLLQKESWGAKLKLCHCCRFFGLSAFQSVRPKGGSFVKVRPPPPMRKFCAGLNIEVSSLQSTVGVQLIDRQPPIRSLGEGSLPPNVHDALYASVRVKRSATNLPTSLYFPRDATGAHHFKTD